MFEGAIKDGGVSTQPWAIPRMGSSVGGSGRGVGQLAGRTSIGISQGLGSTDAGGNFAEGPAVSSGDWLPKHRGLFGGPGIRTGGAA